MNRNAYAGMNIEHLIKNSIVDHPSIIKKLQEKFNIEGAFSNTSGGGIYGDKSDVRVNFACGRYIDVNIKGFKDNVGFNQLTRTTVSHFCDIFKLNNNDKIELENLVISKSKNKDKFLFSNEDNSKWESFFTKNAKQIVKWGFSKNTSREILVLYNRTTSIVKIYAMKDILNNISTDVVFTKGGVNIGDCISFQRKGGNGSLSKHIPKNTIQHPGNNVQLKLKVNRFIIEMEDILLGEYII